MSQKKSTGEFDIIANEFIIAPSIATSLVMRPCSESVQDGDDCYSVFEAGTDYCLYAHITYAQAYHHIYGHFPGEIETREEFGRL